jgi:Flp pilus assembly protein TadG
MRLVHEERGLVGKILVVWLLVLALVVLAAVDGGSILLARIHARDLAQTTADAGAATLGEGFGRRRALQDALAALTEADRNARLERFEVTPNSVTVEVSDEAGTILVGRFGILEDLTEASASVTRRISER